MFTSIPKLPGRLQVLILSNNKLDLSQMSELPSNLKVADLLGDLERSGTGILQNYTFPSSIEELHLLYLGLSCMSGVKFAKGSRLKRLNMNNCRLMTVDDSIIELPLGLKSLDLTENFLHDIDDFTIPQTVTCLNLSYNAFSSLQVMSHIETLYFNENLKSLSKFAIPKDLELKFLDLQHTGRKNFSFDISGAEKLKQLRVWLWVDETVLSKLPVNLQIIEYTGDCKIKGFRRYPDTNIYRRLP